MFELLERHQVNIPALFDSIGLDPSILNALNHRLTYDQYDQLLKQVVILTGNQNVGLHQGELHQRFPNILYYIIMNCETLFESITKYREYQSIIDEGSHFEFDVENEWAVFQFVMQIDAEKYNRHMPEFRLSATIALAKQLTGIDDIDGMIKEVRFKHPAPDDTSEYHRIFKCPVLFDQAMNAIVFHKDILGLPVKHTNKELLSLFEKKARDIIDSISGNHVYTTKVTNIMLKRLQGDTPVTLDTIAAELSTSARSLQVKLEKEGTSYRQLFNEIRKNLAIEYLKDHALSVSEIAYLLGFSEPSIFNRTFKKWTNQTPGLFRKHLNEPGDPETCPHSL